jgi:hypothetical protein
MIFIIDNLNAMIVMGAVILALMFLRTRTVETGIEQNSTYMMKKQAIDMAVWMEDDLLRVGENMNPDSLRFENPVQDNLITRTFIFYRDSVSAPESPPIRVLTRYQLEDAGTKILQEEEIPVYRMVRSVKVGNGAWVDDGGSSTLLSYFRIDMLNRDAVPVDAPATVALAKPDSLRNTRVRFAMVTPFEVRNNTLNQVYYGSTLMLPNYQ